MSFFSLMTNICNKVTCEKVKSPGKRDTHSFLKMSFKITSVNKGLRTSKKLCQTKRWKRLCCNTKLVIEHLARVIPHSKQNYYPKKKKKRENSGDLKQNTVGDGSIACECHAGGKRTDTTERLSWSQQFGVFRARNKIIFPARRTGIHWPYGTETRHDFVS